MSMRKTMTGLLLCAALTAFTGCVQKAPTTDTKTESETTPTTEKEEKKTGELPDFSPEATIEETVLVDANNIKITATELTYRSHVADINLIIENNSDQDLSFISGSMGYNWNSVNNYMLDSSYLNVDVTAGNLANETISLKFDELMLYGLQEIADIQIGFQVKDADYNEVYTGVSKLLTSAAADYDYAPDTYQEAINSGIMGALFDYSIDYFEKRSFIRRTVSAWFQKLWSPTRMEEKPFY
ncbi:hypothetical protein [Ohessyouella blattaphilus]|uniref:Uncharacterized protein n=1 Tax=Ohessyouella blattaphilus TaxID=2949333 RepID=A0ABT1EIG0_9FIRM|nr:hypothetical protein [Ohessyouella blattaphilus]MCP1110489.1 hypothetical protein [Ohessyouella blattaphilus]MCR8563883.1 hypothetical protein [Ohessyouella blattaphilus]